MNTPFVTPEIAPETVACLRTLAAKYETCTFIDSDPCRFLHRYTAPVDIETAAFTAAMLAFGRRDQILCKVNLILDHITLSGTTPAAWVRTGLFNQVFPVSEKKFYRFYSYSDMRTFFTELQNILKKTDTLGTYFKSLYASDNRKYDPFLLSKLISSSFPASRIIPKGTCSACKRIHMFLRWMVRTGSPVDVGLWTWFSPADLIIPMDTHVLSEASKLGLFGQNAVITAGTAKNALQLTQIFKQIWPDDPCKGDFALFGLGVDPDRQRVLSGSAG